MGRDRLLLIQPRTFLNQPGNKPTRYPLTLGAVGAPFIDDKFGNIFEKTYGIKPPKLKIEIFDERLPGADVEECLNAFNPKIVGITATSLSYPGAYKIAQLIKKRDPGIIIVLGGAHVTAVPEAVNEPFDYGIQGPGEESFILLVHKLISKEPEFPLNNLPGLVFRREEKLYTISRVKPQIPFSEYPPVRTMFQYKLLDTDNYDDKDQLIQEGGQLRGRLGVMIYSRGCPFNCRFCANPNRYRPEYRNPFDVAKDIKYLYEKEGMPIFYFYDDTFTIYPEKTKDLTEAIKQLKIKNIEWTASTRAERVDGELLRLMRDSGCCGLGFGVETANGRLNKNLSKGTTMRQVYRASKLCQKIGLGVKWFLMVGVRGQRWQHILEMCRHVKAIKPTSVSVAGLVPFPGSAIYDELKHKPDFGRLASKPKENWERENFSSHTYPSDVMKANEVDLARRLVFSIHRANGTGEEIEETFKLLKELRQNSRCPSNLLFQFYKLLD